MTSMHTNDETRVPVAELLAAKHTSSRISAPGILARIRDGRDLRVMGCACGLMLEHLQEMAQRYYAGDIKAVDEFLQLYCLDDHRPNAPDVREETGL